MFLESFKMLLEFVLACFLFKDEVFYILGLTFFILPLYILDNVNIRLNLLPPSQYEIRACEFPNKI